MSEELLVAFLFGFAVGAIFTCAAFFFLVWVYFYRQIINEKNEIESETDGK